MRAASSLLLPLPPRPCHRRALGARRVAVEQPVVPAGRVGLQAAESLGAPPERVLKTLMAEVDGRPVCVVLASDREVAMKRLASALGVCLVSGAAGDWEPTDSLSPAGCRRTYLRRKAAMRQ